ncbi:hypothetical protein COOONC_27562 [Cooperia oncophora]
MIPIKVRLYLSSRAEMNDVITRAKAAVLGLRVPSPKVPEQSPVQQEPVQNWQANASPVQQPQYAPPPAPEHPMKPSSFAPDPAEFNKPLYMRADSPHNGEYRGYQRGYPPAPMDSYPPAQQMQQNSRPAMPPRDEGMYERKYPPAEPKRFPPEMPHRPPYQSNQAEQRLSDTAPRFFSAPPRNPNLNRPMQPGIGMPPRGIPNQSLREDQKAAGPASDGSYGPPYRSPYGGPPGHPRGPPGAVQSSRSMEEGADGREHPHERYNGPVALQQDDRRPPAGGPRALFPPMNRQDGPPVNGGAPPGSGPGLWRDDDGPPYGGNGSSWPSNMHKPGPNSGPPTRKPLISKPPSAFNDDRPLLQKPAMPPAGRPGGHQPIPPPQQMRQPQPPMNRTPLLGPNFGSGPNIPRPAPPTPKYIELSRLPTEMLRPAVLEQFLRPSVPLQVSSVKVVYSSQGIHMNTLVRLDNPADADVVLNRDGELGIRVRPTTKAIFDEAVDGLPPAVLSATEAAAAAGVGENADSKRDSEHTRRRSRSRSRERRRNKRDPSPRKRQRSRTRSRDRRASRRSRSRSAPKRSRQTTGSTRWCLQLTNVPFRCTEQELIGWMSERVRPSKVTRTFYADGNASDRWIAEFESESLMERAFGIKRLLIGRTVKMCHIENDLADELLKIEDKYGERRKESCEKTATIIDHRDSIKPLMAEPVSSFGLGVDRGAPVSFFPPPARNAAIARGVSAFGPGGYPGANGVNSMIDAGPGARGRGMGRGFPPSSFPRDGPRGRGRGAFDSGTSGTQVVIGGQCIGLNTYMICLRKTTMKTRNSKPPKSPEPEPAAATDDLVASLGPRGTVVSCCGFPSDVTMEDVLGFFKGYPVDPNSVRIRMGDDGIPTGECMLAMKNPEISTPAKNLKAHRTVM